MPETITLPSEKELLEGASISSFPRFENIDEFLSSDFFQKYYSLGEDFIEVPWMYGIAEQEQYTVEKQVCHDGKCRRQVDYLGPVPQVRNIIAENLQRLLLALGYIKIEDFDMSRSIGEGHEIDETDVSYFGFLGNNERQALKRFQDDIGLQADAIVGPETKKILYKKVFESFHSHTISPESVSRLATLKGEFQ